MKSSFNSYDHKNSDERIREILDSAEAFDEIDDIPDRDKLTYANGFYVNCTALFIDIRDSSKMPDNHTRPVLGKIYRAYLSECIAVMNGNAQCRETFISGDCVSGIYSTPKKIDIDAVFNTAAQLSSIIRILNWRLAQKDYSQFVCGIGIAYGRALMLKAGYKGSGVNDVIWMGDVVNETAKLCQEGNRDGQKELQVSTTIFDNLNEHNKGLLSAVRDWPFDPVMRYEGSIIDLSMQEYLSGLEDRKAISCPPWI